MDEVRIRRRFVRQWLGNYKYIKNQILMSKKEYEDFICTIYNPLLAADYSKNITGGTSRGDMTADSVVMAEKSCVDYLKLLSDRIESLKQQRELIEQIVMSISDPNEKKVIELIYINDVKWTDITGYFNYEIAQIKRFEARAVDRIYPRIITVMGGDEE